MAYTMEKFINTKEVSCIVPIKTRTIQAWCRKGLMPHYNVNGNLMFLPSEIQEWLETKKVEAKGDRIQFEFVKQIRVR